MTKKMSVANLVMLAGAVVTLLFSFFAFFSYAGQTRSAWSTDIGAFVTTIPAFMAIFMLVWGGFEIAGQKLPAQVLTYTPTQLKTIWGVSAAGVMIAHLTRSNAHYGFGFWLMFIGSLAMAAGAVMALLGKGTELVDFSKITVHHEGDSATPPPPPASPPLPPPAG